MMPRTFNKLSSVFQLISGALNQFVRPAFKLINSIRRQHRNFIMSWSEMFAQRVTQGPFSDQTRTITARSYFRYFSLRYHFQHITKKERVSIIEKASQLLGLVAPFLVLEYNFMNYRGIL